MRLLCPEELELLAAAAQDAGGELEVQVAGPGHIEQFGRLVMATGLQHAGYLEPLPDAGAFARWRIRPAILADVRSTLRSHRRGPAGRRPPGLGPSA